MILNPGNGSNTIKNEHVLKDGAIVPSAAEHVVLGTTIDSCLTCCFHLKQLCKKVANKLNDLTRVAPHPRHSQRWLIYSAVLTGELS